jgi:5-formyltetrahydrofolate cyclo-ligase
LLSNNSEKTHLRRKLLQQRCSLAPIVWQEKSLLLCQRLQDLFIFAQAQTILAYFSFRQEPDLSSLFTLQHRWGFSRCVGDALIWHSWKPKDPLNFGIYGIPEPDCEAPLLQPSEIDLILVPAVACDYQGYRLGYGGGFYDRLLNASEWRGIPTLGIIFDFAYLPQLPVDSWDQRLDGICTEKYCLLF